ncbi:MAG: outer membrane lipoprotein-sorting protein [Endomicrobia bacterium]|nr:outer membrane lipoprotein-sorting protein [Endomicrobiia bacterium]
MLFINIIFSSPPLFSFVPEEILKKVDQNLNFNSAIMTIQMEIILPKQPIRVKRFKVWISENNSYVEFFNKEDKHIRYLKLGKKMWVYDKEENNTFLISGHLLKQGIMGSDISYEDLLESEKIYEKYEIQLAGEEKFQERDCYVIILTAKVKEVHYFKRKMWVDKEYFIPLKEERYTKNDKLLKVFELTDIKFYKDRFYPTKSIISDKLKKDTKTIIIVEDIIFDQKIPENFFTRRHLER